VDIQRSGGSLRAGPGDAVTERVDAVGLARSSGGGEAAEGGKPSVDWLQARQGVRRAASLAIDISLLGLTAAIFLVLNKRFYSSGIGYDEEFFAWGGWCIRKGLAPYRDFIEFKPPLVFITHAFAQALFGFKNMGYRTYFAAFPLVSVLALQTSLVARRVPRFMALGMMVAVIWLFVNPAWHDTALSDCESIGISYYMLGLALFLWEGRSIKLTTALGGFFMACCALSKEPFIPAVLATWLGCFFLRGTPSPSRASSLLFARYSIIGAAVLAAALCIYMVPTGAMRAYIEMARDYARIYRDPVRSYCVAVGVYLPSTPMGDLTVAWDKMRAAFLNEAVLGYLAPLAVPGAVFAFRRSPALLVTMGAACLAGIWAVTASKCQWVHYYNMPMAGMIFVLVAGLDSMKGPLRAAHPRVLAGVSVAIVLLVYWHTSPDIEREAKAQYTRLPWHEPAPGLLAFIEQNTVTSDRIFTTGPPILYAQADRVSAVRQSNIIDEILGLYDGETDEEKLRPIYLQLVKNKPKVVFLDPEHGNRKGRHNRVLLMPFLAEFKYKKINDYLYLRP
jgi:hypothetical protein